METRQVQAQINDIDLAPILTNSGLCDDNGDISNEINLLSRISPRPNNLIITKPDVAANWKGRQLKCGVIVPDVARSLLREFGMMATILKVAPNILVDEPEVLPGRHIVMPEYSGKPLYLGRETPYWIIGLDEIMSILVEDDKGDSSNPND